MCNIEFPHFGASYPDAHCIDGYLWDMDSYEDGCYTVGGYDPCPFCNTDEWLKIVLDNEEFASREEALEWVEKMREMWGANHFHDTAKKVESEIPKDLEEAAEKYVSTLCDRADEGLRIDTTLESAFKAGAEWQKEQMLKKAVEGHITNAGGEFGYDIATFRFDENHTYTVLLPHEEGRKHGDKVSIIILPKEDKQ